MAKTPPHPLIADYIEALPKSFSESGQILTRLWAAHGTVRINQLVDEYFKANPEKLEGE